MKRLLFLGAGRRVELLRAFRKARERVGLSGHLQLWAMDSDRCAPALRVADRGVIAPPLADSYHNRFFEDLVSDMPTTVVPLIDPYVTYVSTLEPSERLQLWGIRGSAVQVIQDKWRTFEYFRRHGIPTPNTVLPGEGEVSLPAVVKPRHGSAGKDVMFAETEEEVALALKVVEQPVLQAFASGPEITIDLVCAPGAGLLGLGMRKRLKVRGGEVSIGETIWSEEIALVCQELFQLLDPEGPITAQCFLDDEKGPLFTEVNGRFGGGVPLSFRAGMDVVPQLCRIAAGQSFRQAALLTATPGWRMARFDEAIYDPPE